MARGLDHDKLRRTRDAALGRLMHERELTLEDAEAGAGSRRAPRTRTERIERLKVVLVQAIKDEAHRQPHGDWWNGEQFRRHHVCKAWLVDHVPDEAIDLFKSKKGESLSLRSLIAHTDRLAHWTRAQFRAEQEPLKAKGETEAEADPRVKLLRAERAKRQHPRREG